MNDDTTLGAALARESGRLGLVIWHGVEPRVVSIEPGRSLVLGRADPADIVIAAPTLSREHVRVTSDGERVDVVDLGSKNGLRVHGERVDRATLSSGDAFEAGGVQVLVTALAPDARTVAATLSRHALLHAIEVELERSRITGRPFTVVVLDGEGASHLLPLRPIDVRAELGAGLTCVLLPELEAPDAVRMLADRLPLARGGVAGSRSAGTAAGLVEMAKAALASAPAQQRFVSCEQPSEEEPELVTASARIREVLALADRFAASDRPVLVLGETGAGKEIVAQRIHASSARREGPFRVLNCGAIPPSLVESTLFGHERGAFTGALERRKGPFEEASGGTLFLDEIGELPAAAQSALLRVLETGRLLRVGSTSEIAVDTRLVAATHRDLAREAAEGRFRSDLFHRVSVLVIEVPPLRERPEDVVALAHAFMRRACASSGRPPLSFDASALASMLAHDWPGNVRELRNVVERAVLLASGPELGVVDLAEHVRPPPSPPGALSEGSWDLRTRLRDAEGELIVAALEASGGNQVAAAKLLGLPRRTLVHKIGKLGLRRRWEHP